MIIITIIISHLLPTLFFIIMRFYFQFYLFNNKYYSKKWLLNMPYHQLTYKMKRVVDAIHYEQYKSNMKKLKIKLNKEISKW